SSRSTTCSTCSVLNTASTIGSQLRAMSMTQAALPPSSASLAFFAASTSKPATENFAAINRRASTSPIRPRPITPTGMDGGIAIELRTSLDDGRKPGHFPYGMHRNITPSCPALCRASTSSFWHLAQKDVDGIGSRFTHFGIINAAGRLNPTCGDKPGHDEPIDSQRVKNALEEFCGRDQCGGDRPRPLGQIAGDGDPGQERA